MQNRLLGQTGDLEYDLLNLADVNIPAFVIDLQFGQFQLDRVGPLPEAQRRLKPFCVGPLAGNVPYVHNDLHCFILGVEHVESELLET